VRGRSIGVYLIKPNVGELAKLIGVEKLEMEEVNAAAKIIAKGGAEIGLLQSQGAVLVTKDSYDYVPAKCC
jgi:6-phosphofructokinase 2